MLQRKQTLWTLLAAILAALTFRFPFYHGNVVIGSYGHELRELRAYPTYINGTSGSILITIVTIIIIVGALWNILNYKNRTRQFWVTIGLFVLSLVNILLFWMHSGKPDFTEGDFSLTSVLALAIPFCFYFAAMGIRKDEKLVKSADRIR